MSHLRIAMVTAALWLAALVVAGLAIATLGTGPAGLAAALASLVLGLGAGLVLAGQRDRREQETLVSVALAAGLTERTSEPLTIAGVVARLAGRLEKAHHFRSAIAALHQPALVVDETGTIVAVSAGTTALAPAAVEGATLDAVFGPGYLNAGGGAADEAMTVLGGRRFAVRRMPLAANRFVLELVPAGVYLEDDDLDAFATALASGQTSFRFERTALLRNPALQTLDGAMASIDAGLVQLDRVAAGHDELPDALAGPLGSVARRLNDFVGALVEQVAEEQALRRDLEERLGAVGRLLSEFEARARQMGAMGSESREDADLTGQALEAELAARRTHAVVGDIDRMTTEIDKMVQAIEDVSFRTNLLALNAAVEAARAGEKGAGFTVVADEVRQLAQLTNRSAKDIRSVVKNGRAYAETGVAEAQSLQKMMADLEAHLRNLSNETDTIAATLDEGGAALRRLTGRMASLGEQDRSPARAADVPAKRLQLAARP